MRRYYRESSRANPIMLALLAIPFLMILAGMKGCAALSTANIEPGEASAPPTVQSKPIIIEGEAKGWQI